MQKIIAMALWVIIFCIFVFLLWASQWQVYIEVQTKKVETVPRVYTHKACVDCPTMRVPYNH